LGVGGAFEGDFSTKLLLIMDFAIGIKSGGGTLREAGIEETDAATCAFADSFLVSATPLLEPIADRFQ
jgi:hypothetical protein